MLQPPATDEVVAGPTIDSAGRIVEHSFIGSREDYEAMAGAPVRTNMLHFAVLHTRL